MSTRNRRYRVPRGTCEGAKPGIGANEETWSSQAARTSRSNVTNRLAESSKAENLCCLVVIVIQSNVLNQRLARQRQYAEFSCSESFSAPFTEKWFVGKQAEDPIFSFVTINDSVRIAYFKQRMVLLPNDKRVLG